MFFFAQGAGQPSTRIASTADIGDAIRARRKALKLTQRQLAALAGLSLEFVNGIENGKPTAEIGKTLELLTALGIDLEARVR
ncbi:helix-turn-helix transcriptional regulator [Niveispirillum irakense]|uniref:helix-turn-helix transcriptional regulator n=1 Tax=Niveispirillum irakense TaxID=34011 RepID=UPI0004216A85|nr:helix-turn-helix transcriptional regulator [Niveispirillum irakense]